MPREETGRSHSAPQSNDSLDSYFYSACISLSPQSSDPSDSYSAGISRSPSYDFEAEEEITEVMRKIGMYLMSSGTVGLENENPVPFVNEFSPIATTSQLQERELENGSTSETSPESEYLFSNFKSRSKAVFVSLLRNLTRLGARGTGGVVQDSYEVQNFVIDNEDYANGANLESTIPSDPAIISEPISSFVRKDDKAVDALTSYPNSMSLFQETLSNLIRVLAVALSLTTSVLLVAWPISLLNLSNQDSSLDENVYLCTGLLGFLLTCSLSFSFAIMSGQTVTKSVIFQDILPFSMAPFGVAVSGLSLI